MEATAKNAKEIQQEDSTQLAASAANVVHSQRLRQKSSHVAGVWVQAVGN